jgi:hypothetical protein
VRRPGDGSDSVELGGVSISRINKASPRSNKETIRPSFAILCPLAGLPGVMP